MRQQQIRRRAARQGDHDAAASALPGTTARRGSGTDRAAAVLAAIDAVLAGHTG